MKSIFNFTILFTKSIFFKNSSVINFMIYSLQDLYGKTQESQRRVHQTIQLYDLYFAV